MLFRRAFKLRVPFRRKQQRKQQQRPFLSVSDDEVYLTKCMNIFESAAVEKNEYDLSNATALGVKIHPRDIASLELARGSSLRARRRRSYSLNPRREFIVMNFGAVKAILVKNDKLVLFECDSSPLVENWGNTLPRKIPHFTDCVESGMSVSFELGMLEEILKEATGLFDRRLRLLKPLVKNLVKSSPDEQEAALQRLGPLEDALQVYEMETREARECLRGLLVNDEDMHALVSLTDDSVHSFDPLNMTEEQSATVASVELLLESYVHRMSRQLDTASYFQQQLSTWRNIMSMSSERTRNQILTYSLQTNIAAVSLGASSMVAGIMGMNVSHGYEENPYLFYGIATTLIAGSATFQLASNKYLLGSSITQRFREEATKIEGVKSLLVEDPARLDDAIKIVFDALDGSEQARRKFGERLDLEEFTEIFLTAHEEERELSENDIKGLRDNAKQLFRLLDTDGSGAIDREEIATK